MLFDFLLAIVVVVLSVPVMVLAVQVMMALLANRVEKPLPTAHNRPKVVVLMPAHNEALGIAQPIASILPQLKQGDQLLVVADNCTDNTADIARQAGAQVIERQNLNQRGKGYALDYGIQHLKTDPPEVLLIVDADCMVHAGAIDALVSAVVADQLPVQALYLMKSQAEPNLKTQIAEFAWVVKNHVRPLGMRALGMPCQLMGTGMAFLWHDISQVNLASGHIVEDMKLGVDLARIGKAPSFLPTALVTSVFQSGDQTTSTQRARWEHGHLSVILHDAPGLILQAIQAKNLRMLAMACDLIVPPLAALTLACVAVWLASLLIGQWQYTTALLALLMAAIMLAWLGFGRQIISFRQLCYAPIYVLAKIPLYIRFFIRRQVEWVRSKRD